ncbi:hypothetical protein J1TS3_45540 [Siminovitchia fordii]|uniref:Uncharacterized protein n=1 Tax=Siminovitchia fordii TaxID=254759 RepID=A0ABQ4KE70_9BACI|nr:hypothetical protein J1TS3_45540 [Siminovitchia fordii]
MLKASKHEAPLKMRFPIVWLARQVRSLKDDQVDRSGVDVW